MNKNIVIQAENISKIYRSERTIELQVLQSISLEIIGNEISVIVGASGAGKSTLLHILAGLDKPDLGKVLYLGENIFSYKESALANFRNKNIGLVFQFHHLLPEFTAIENISIPQMINGTSLNDANIKSEELLDIVGLSERSNHKPAELSGGEQQRVAFARALANDPKVILADEPTGNLDTPNSEKIHNFILDLKNKYNKTLVIVTHNRDLVNLADNIFELKDGKLI